MLSDPIFIVGQSCDCFSRNIAFEISVFQKLTSVNCLHKSLCSMLENIWFSDAFTGYRKRPVVWTGLKSGRERLTHKCFAAFLALTLNRFHTLFWCFHCWLWTNKCRLGILFVLLHRAFRLLKLFEWGFFLIFLLMSYNMSSLCIILFEHAFWKERQKK